MISSSDVVLPDHVGCPQRRTSQKRDRILFSGPGKHGYATGGRANPRLEQAGGVLTLQFLAQFDQLLLECHEPITDGIRQVDVIHSGIR